MIVYKHTNKINGKSYIGITEKSIGIRLSEHYKEYLCGNTNRIFPKALGKYGLKNFYSEILETCENREQANKREEYWIEYYDTFRNGYNMTIGGNNLQSSTKGKSYLEIYNGDMEKINSMQKSKGEKLRGKPLSEETKQKMKESHWSKQGIKNDWSVQPPHTEESKQKITNGLINFWKDNEEARKKCSERNKGENNPNYGVKWTEEQKEAARRRMNESPPKKYECKHCGGLFTKGMLNRWHNDNCKKAKNESKKYISP